MLRKKLRMITAMTKKKELMMATGTNSQR